jgi:hypothetical protein
MRYPDFNVAVNNRLNAMQQLVYIHVSALSNRDHPVYTIDRKWASLVEVEKETGFKLAKWNSPNGKIQYEAVGDIQYGYYLVVRSTEWDKWAKVDRESYLVYQISNKGRALRMGLDAYFTSPQDAEDMVRILHNIEVGEF